LFQLLQSRDPPVQALPRESREFDHIESTGGLGPVVKFEALRQGKSFVSR
jgi:hypothetical protein